MEIKITKTTNPRPRPADETKIAFGKNFTDHMFMMDYTTGKGWHDARIVPYGPIELSPAAMCLHYGQELFEGMKAFRSPSGEVQLFRPKENMKRINASAARLIMPELDGDFVLEALRQLILLDQDWIPKAPGTSLYVRPFMFSTTPGLGVHPADNYLFMIILSPAGHYFPQGLAPTTIYVEDEDVRSWPGGTGFTKAAANYVISLHAQEKAEAKGYSQVLWLDGIHKKYVEEIGAANAFFMIDGVAYTCPLTGTILPGVTRDSVITVLEENGIKVCTDRLSIDDLIAAIEDGRCTEIFSCGTAAVISPVGHMGYKDKDYVIGGNEVGPISHMLYDIITGIQNSKIPDKHGWLYTLGK